MQLTQLVALRSALALFLAACVFVLPVEGQIRFQKSYSGNQDYTPIALTSTSEGGYAILANTQISPPDSQIIHQDFSLTVTGEDQEPSFINAIELNNDIESDAYFDDLFTK